MSNSIDITKRIVTPTQLKKCVAVAFKTKRALMIMGQPGCGKSDIVRGIADQTNRPVIDMRLAQFDSTDIRGIPYFCAETNTMEWATPGTLPTDEKLQNAIIFLDEINTAPPLVQSAAYQLVLDRKLGEYALPEGVDIIAAGNRNKDRGATFDMAMPLRNRFMFVELGVNFDDWQEWAVENDIHKDVIAYLSFKKGELNQFEEAVAQQAYSFATPRSWTYVSDTLKQTDDIEIIDILVAGSVGEGIASEFVTHLEYIARLPSPEDIVNGKVKEKLDIDKISAFYSLAYGSVQEMISTYGKLVKEGKPVTPCETQFDHLYEFVKLNCKDEMVFFTVSSLMKQWRAAFPAAPSNERIIPTRNENFKEFAQKYKQYMDIG